MASRRLLDQNLETSNLRSRKHKYPLFFLTIHCLFLISILLCHIPAAQAQPYNNIKAKIEGDTTLFTIEVKDAELKDVLRALAKQNNLNIIVSEDITAKATFSFDRIKFKDALEVITKANGLNYVIQSNVLWIGKKEDIAKAGEDIVM